MSIFDRWLKPKPPVDADLDEWALHHDDPRSAAGMRLVNEARGALLTPKELGERWQAANTLVGQRAPADYGEFVAYGYFEGRQDESRP